MRTTSTYVTTIHPAGHLATSYPHTHARTPGGLPIGAVLLKQHVADVMSPGDHGSTFAGNPLVCHAACAVFDIIAEQSFLDAIAAKVCGRLGDAGVQC